MLKVGQLWCFEEANEACFLVLQTEELKGEKICHIAIENVNLLGPEGQPIHTIGHLPFLYDAVAKSALKLIETRTELPDYQEGYQNWRAAFDREEAGVWSVTVAEAVDGIKKAFNND